jgi:1-acyl-sn-glycerol-3-phosphate acyltransferase
VADFVYPPVVFAAKSVFKGLGIKFVIEGAENLPREGGVVLAVNHTSYLDFALGGIPAEAIGRHVRFMAKDGIFKHKIAGPLMRGMKHIPVDREAGSQSFRDAVGALKAGEIVGVFPEATMSKSFEIKEFKNGAVRMAISAKAPIVPMIIFGGQRILYYGHKDLTRGRTVCLTLGEPMYPERGQDPDEITIELRSRMQKLLDESLDRYPAPLPGEDAWWLPKRRGGTAPEYVPETPEV